MKAKIRGTYQFGKPEVPEGWPEGTMSYTVTLRYRGRRMTVPYFCGPLCGEPSIADVLYCVLMDSGSVENARSFEEWCSEFGYDTDSRKAERIYNGCCRQRDKVQFLLWDMYDTATRWDEDEIRGACAEEWD